MQPMGLHLLAIKLPFWGVSQGSWADGGREGRRACDFGRGKWVQSLTSPFAANCLQGSPSRCSKQAYLLFCSHIPFLMLLVYPKHTSNQPLSLDSSPALLDFSSVCVDCLRKDFSSGWYLHYTLVIKTATSSCFMSKDINSRSLHKLTLLCICWGH